MSNEPSNLVAVKSCATEQEAEIVRNVLEAGGVLARITGDDYAGLPLMTSGGVQVLVLEDDLVHAQEILASASNC